VSFEYLTRDAPEKYPLANASRPPLLFNPQKLKFNLVALPTLGEIRQTVDEYGNLRLDARWQELMQTPTRYGRAKSAAIERIRLFQVGGSSLLWVAQAHVWQVLGVSSTKKLASNLDGMSVEQQRMLASPLKPKNIPEMLSFYRSRADDETGYGHLMSVLDRSTTAEEFFGILVDSIFRELAEVDYRLPEPEGREAMGNQAKPCEATGTFWVMRCYVQSLAIYPVAAHRLSDYGHRAR
jgi:hypothetical protein